MAVQGRVARLTALALATGTLMAAGAGLASPASAAADTRQMTADGVGSALKITINLPTAAAAALGTSQIVQTISLTTGKVSTVGLPTATSSAVLGAGNIPKVSDLLAQSTKAALGGKLEDTKAGLVDIDSSGVKVSVLPLSSKVADPTTVTSGVLAKSNSAIAHISISAPIAAASSITAPVQGVLDTALGLTTGTTNSSVATVADTLNGAINTLNKTATQTTPVTAPVQAAVDSLTKTLGGLTTTLNGLSATTNLVSLDAVTSEQTITRKGDVMTSSVANAVKNLNILGGLVKVDAITSQATASAGGAPGTAKAVTNAPVFKVDIANGALTALLDQNGLNVNALGTGLPPALQDTVNGAVATVNGLLNTVAGVNVALGKGQTVVSPDGTSAVADVATTVLTVDPPVLHTAGLLEAGKQLVKIELVSANAAATSRLVPAPAPAAPGVTPVNLPRTGGSLPLTGAIATLLLGTALVARRRRTAAAE
ncbi:MAG: hypothetical protein ABIO67_06780 [Mycobacteriales bacterium]